MKKSLFLNDQHKAYYHDLLDSTAILKTAMIIVRIKASRPLILNGTFSFVLLYFVFNLKTRGKKDDETKLIVIGHVVHLH